MVQNKMIIFRHEIFFGIFITLFAFTSVSQKNHSPKEKEGNVSKIFQIFHYLTSKGTQAYLLFLHTFEIHFCSSIELSIVQPTKECIIWKRLERSTAKELLENHFKGISTPEENTENPDFFGEITKYLDEQFKKMSQKLKSEKHQQNEGQSSKHGMHKSAASSDLEANSQNIFAINSSRSMPFHSARQSGHLPFEQNSQHSTPFHSARSPNWFKRGKHREIHSYEQEIQLASESEKSPSKQSPPHHLIGQKIGYNESKNPFVKFVKKTVKKAAKPAKICTNCLMGPGEFERRAKDKMWKN